MHSLLSVQSFFDAATHTVSYLIADTSTQQAAIIDPVLNFQLANGHVTTTSIDQILSAANAQNLSIQWVLETHVHADHLSAAYYVKQKTGASICIGEHIREVQRIFNPLFHLSPAAVPEDFDRLLQDHATLPLGNLTIEVIHTPGHTPACVAYRIHDVVFVGDTIFMPDFGTARADFPGGNAATLYHSIQTLLALPDDTTLFLCHDYKAPGRNDYVWQTTVKQQREHNVHVHTGVTEEQFVAMRQTRDKTLPPPALLLPAIQVNLRAGRLSKTEDNGTAYIKIPLTLSDTVLLQQE